MKEGKGVQQYLLGRDDTLEGQEEAFRIQVSRNSSNQVKLWVRKQDETFLGAEGGNMRQIVGHLWRGKWDALSGPLA